MGQFLLVLFVFLVFVMVLGHGMWLALAWCLRQLADSEEFSTDGSRPPAAADSKSCTSCGAPSGIRFGVCAFCGYQPIAVDLAQRKAELDVVDRQLKDWLAIGQLTEDEFQRLRQLTARRRETLFPNARSVEQRPTAPAGAQAENGNVAAPVEDDIVLGEVIEAELAPDDSSLRVVGAHAVHPLDRDGPAEASPAAPMLPVQSRRQFADVLQSFMAKSNVRWGEIVAGLAIVGGYVGAVVSLWNDIRGYPFLPALIFLVGTAAFYGAGIYTLRKWNLVSTSRALLMITLLLTPLNFLAAIALSEQRPVLDFWYLSAVILGLAAFGGMTYSAAKELVRGRWARVVGPIMGAVVCQLFIARLASSGMEQWRLQLLGLAPLVCFWPAVAWPRKYFRRRMGEAALKRLVLIVGVSGFALLTTWGLLLSKQGDWFDGLVFLTPLLCLAAAACLELAVQTQRRLKKTLDPIWRTGVLAAALAAGFIMAGSLLLAWPRPSVLLIGILNAVTLWGIAYRSRIDFLYYPAMACAALSLALGCELASQSPAGPAGVLNFGESLLSPWSSIALTGLAAAIAGAAFGLRNIGRSRDALAHLFGAVGVAAVSLAGAFAAVGLRGADPAVAAGIAGGFGLAAMLANTFVRRAELGWLGAALQLAAILAAVCLPGQLETRFHLGAAFGVQPWTAALTCFGVLAMAQAVGLKPILKRWPHERNATAAADVWTPLNHAALAATAIAACFLLADSAVGSRAAAVQAGLWCSFSLVWLAGAILQGDPHVFRAFQCFAYLAWVFAVRAGVPRQDWLSASHLQLQIVAASIWSLLWTLLRRWPPKLFSLRPWLRADGVSPDHIVLAAAMGGLFYVGYDAVGPALLAALHGNPTLGDPTQAAGGAAALSLGCLWAAWLVLLIAVVGIGWERRWRETIALTALVVAAAPLLLAASLAAQAPVDLVFRGAHGAICLAFAVSAATWLPGVVRRLQKSVGSLISQEQASHEQASHEQASHGRIGELAAFGVLINAAPVVGATLLAAAWRLDAPVDRLWEWREAMWQLGGPMFLVVAALIICERRERNGLNALAAGVLFPLTLVCCFVLVHGQTALTAGAYAGILPMAMLGFGAGSLVWLLLDRPLPEHQSPEHLSSIAPLEPPQPPATARAQQVQRLETFVFVAAAMALLHALWSGGVALFTWGRLPTEAAFLGSNIAVVAFLLCGASLLWLGRSRRHDWSGHALLGAMAAFSSILALSLAGLLVQGYASPLVGGGFARRVLIVSLATISMSAALFSVGLFSIRLRWRGALAVNTPWRKTLRRIAAAAPAWSLVINACLALLAVILVFQDPAPGWPIGVLVASAVSTALWAARFDHRALTYNAACYALSAATVLMCGPWVGLWSRPTGLAVWELFIADSCLLLAIGGVSLVWSMWRTKLTPMRAARLPSLHAFAAVLTTSLFCAWITLCFFIMGVFGKTGFEVTDLWGAAAAYLLTALLLASLWSRKGLYALPCLYGWSVGLTILALAHTPWRGEQLAAATLTALAWHILLTGMLWRTGADLAILAMRCGIPEPVDGLRRLSQWLPYACLLEAAPLSLAAIGFALSGEDRSVQVWAGFVPALAGVGLGCFAQKERRFVWQRAALALGGLAAILLCWTDLPPTWNDITWLRRAIRALVAMIALSAMSTFAAARIFSAGHAWREAVRRSIVWWGAAAACSLAAVLFIEAFHFGDANGLALSIAEIAAVAVVLLGAFALLILFAVSPRIDPLHWSEEKRQRYVYAAQAALGLLLAHVFLARPALFRYFFHGYWPYLVMGISYAGVALGEIFRRLRLNVLSEPLQNTGALLPLIPCLAFRMADSNSDYTLVLFGVGLLYGAMSLHRHSLLLGAGAAIALNGALWSLLSEQSWKFSEHPQIWLIPPAASVLAAAHLMRRRLAAAQLTSLRYSALAVIYVSSTGEIFLPQNQTLLPPMILAGLAVLGMFLGMMFRVRAFLYLGFSFFLVAICSMVARAAQAVDSYWPWWVFLLAMGVIILTIFGLFEKKRTAILEYAERLRAWEP